MYKIILVDDEVNALLGLKVILDFEKLNITTVLTSTNAIDALEIIKKERPDFIISDISMPQMTGLQMITSIKEIGNYFPQIIILSGYSTFSYAKEAIDLGVKSYLLKPVDEDELNSVLQSLKTKLETQKHSIDETLILENQLIKLLNGQEGANTAQLHEFKKRFDNNFFLGYFLVKYHEETEYDFSSEDYDSFNNKIINAIASNISKKFENICFSYSNKEIVVIASAKNVSEINAIIYALTSKLSEEQNVQVCFYSSPHFSDASDIVRQFNDLKNAAIQGISETNSLSSPLAFSGQDFIDIYEMLLSISTNFDTLFQDEIKPKIMDVFAYANEKSLPACYFISIINTFVVSILKHIADFTDDINIYLLKLDSIKSTKSKNSIHSLRNEYIDMIMTIYATLMESKKEQQNEVFYSIITYVNNNYTENLTLKSLAAKFFVNPIYLGRVFKKQIGLLFNDYLTNIRIEKSKVLLLKTSKKIYEIASEVGFNDPNYFIAKFLKSEQVTPSQYRKNLTNTD